MLSPLPDGGKNRLADPHHYNRFRHRHKSRIDAFPPLAKSCIRLPMKIPQRIQPLVDDGVVDEVISQLMSGKEASVYIVRCGSEIRCAKVYKEAIKRSFKSAATYQEGRKVRNTRRARAMEKGSRYGRRQQEEVWQNAEVDALYRLARAGVRVPQPYGCFDGVLLMELITDEDGNAAPRLNDVYLTEEQALEDHAQIMRDVVRMLCAGLVHGDLSEFNVLVDEYGPVIIDLPQAVDASANNNARKMLTRDIENMTEYYSQYAPSLKGTRYAEEIWALYEEGELHPDTELTGRFDAPDGEADVDTVLAEIKAVLAEEQARLERLRADEQD
jgi:RIO kinase 1